MPYSGRSSKRKVRRVKKKRRITRKPLIKRLSSIKAIRGIADSTPRQLVTKGREGFIDREMMKERTSFLGEFNL